MQGWCIAGGTDMVLNADLIIAGEGPGSGTHRHGWGVPEAPWVWVAPPRPGAGQAYLFTGDELTASEAARVE